jgi:hypothetical protein
MSDVYFIRTLADVPDALFAPPRSRDTVRRSMNGELCVLAFAENEVPDGWVDGRTVDEMREHLALPEHEGVWWSAEDI